ncbi:unnamed protein product [Sphagnum jensenii]|uniref:Methylated-DNA--protein-cysteine methyltransferase n=1 Tax=Sphagnum jensenii TaxID=128206 RepID=A0ABP0VCK6_9BRYO
MSSSSSPPPSISHTAATAIASAITGPSYRRRNKKAQVTPFAWKVYNACTCIPPGKVSTYGMVAKFIGKPKASRAVGSALRRNPHAPHVPCHRVISSDGSIGGFFGESVADHSNVQLKKVLLTREGVLFTDADKTKVDPSCITEPIDTSKDTSKKEASEGFLAKLYSWTGRSKTREPSM